MACVTACPSGVQYDSLLEAARPQVERDANRGVGDRAFRRLIFAMFPHPGRLRALSWPLGVYQKLGIQRLVQSSPGFFRCCPSACSRWSVCCRRSRSDRPSFRHAFRRRERSASVSHCCSAASSVCSSRDVNEATARVLAAEGCEVVVPQTQACCGALAEHAGEEADAMAAARKLIDAFEGRGADTVVINAAGCGSAMKRYGHLLRNDPAYAAKAKAFAAKCKDISEVLAELEPRAPRGAVAAQSRVSRRLSPAACSGRAGAAAPRAAVDSRRRGARDPRIGNLLRIRRHLQPAGTGSRRRAARSQSAEHPERPMRT